MNYSEILHKYIYKNIYIYKYYILYSKMPVDNPQDFATKNYGETALGSVNSDILTSDIRKE